MNENNKVICKEYVKQNYIHRDLLKEEIDKQYDFIKTSSNKEQEIKHRYTIQVLENLIKTIEEWKDIKGYEGVYQISKSGKVRRLYKNGEIKKVCLKPFKDRCGYDVAPLHINKKRKNKLVHRLVAETFIPNPNNYPVVNHIDGNKNNNYVTNLEWCTQKYNIQESIRLGLRKNKKRQAV